MPSVFIAERLLTGGSLATMALPDWQSGEYATDYTKFLATTQQRLTSNEFKQMHPFTIGNRFYHRRKPNLTQHTIVKGHQMPYECSQHRYSPTQHLHGAMHQLDGIGFCGLKSPSQADSHGFYRPKPIEADRSTKNTSEISDVFCVSLTSNTQRSFSNKIN